MRPLSASLDLVATEVGDLLQLTDQLQRVISRLAAGAPLDASTLMEAQAVDMLSQRIDGLAGFVRALAGLAPPDLTADLTEAVRGLRLADQAHRLSGVAAIPEPSGELTTFWD